MARRRAVARAALGGYVETTVGEATHYHADYVAPRWAPLLAKVAQIGQHIFYRWPGALGTARGVYRPLHRRAARSFVDASATPARPADGRPTQSPTVAGPVTDGTVMKRAPDDVGGLLDTSKGWTLHIPGPGRYRQRGKLIATQKGTAREHRPGRRGRPGRPRGGQPLVELE